MQNFSWFLWSFHLSVKTLKHFLSLLVVTFVKAAEILIKAVTVAGFEKLNKIWKT